MNKILELIAIYKIALAFKLLEGGSVNSHVELARHFYEMKH